MANKRKMSTQMAKAAFRTFFKKSATLKYPDVPAPVAEGFRGKQVLNIENCIGCALCSRDCPTNAIEYIAYEGKKRPVIHLERCVFCYQCADSCPKNVFQKSKVFELAVIDKSTLLLKPNLQKVQPQATPSTEPPK
jgi:formate hydrogenlyase subunit 6/NADH:ubiquinone oxidoreductase subunit I